MAANNWQNLLPSQAREASHVKIMKSIRRYNNIRKGPLSMSEIFKMTLQFEEQVFSSATDLDDYYRRIDEVVFNLEKDAENSEAQLSAACSGGVNHTTPDTASGNRFQLTGQALQRQQLNKNGMTAVERQRSAVLPSAMTGLPEIRMPNVGGQSLYGLPNVSGLYPNPMNDSTGMQLSQNGLPPLWPNVCFNSGQGQQPFLKDQRLSPAYQQYLLQQERLTPQQQMLQPPSSHFHNQFHHMYQQNQFHPSIQQPQPPVLQSAHQSVPQILNTDLRQSLPGQHQHSSIPQQQLHFMLHHQIPDSQQQQHLMGKQSNISNVQQLQHQQTQHQMQQQWLQFQQHQQQNATQLHKQMQMQQQQSFPYDPHAANPMHQMPYHQTHQHQHTQQHSVPPYSSSAIPSNRFPHPANPQIPRHSFPPADNQTLPLHEPSTSALRPDRPSQQLQALQQNTQHHQHEQFHQQKIQQRNQRPQKKSRKNQAKPNPSSSNSSHSVPSHEIGEAPSQQSQYQSQPHPQTLLQSLISSTLVNPLQPATSALENEQQMQQYSAPLDTQSSEQILNQTHTTPAAPLEDAHESSSPSLYVSELESLIESPIQILDNEQTAAANTHNPDVEFGTPGISPPLMNDVCATSDQNTVTQDENPRLGDMSDTAEGPLDRFLRAMSSLPREHWNIGASEIASAIDLEELDGNNRS